MAQQFDGDTEYGDGEPTPSRSEARRLAAEDVDVAELADGDEPAETPDSAEGTTPEAEAEAPTDAGQGTTPEAEEPEEREAFLSDVDTSDWTDEEKRTFGQYKGSVKELAKALSETKRHSNEQASELRRLKEAAAAGRTSDEPEPAGGPPAAEVSAQPTDAASSAADALPDTSEVQEIRGNLKLLWDENQAAKARQAKIVDDGKGRAREIEQTRGEIRYVEKRMKAEGLADIDRDLLQSELLKMRQDLSELLLADTNERIEYNNLSQTRRDLADRFNAGEQGLRSISERFVSQHREKATRDKALQAQVKQERQTIESALTRAIDTLKVPKDRRQKFEAKILALAEAHPTRIENLDEFFLNEGRELLEFGHVTSPGSAPSYAEQKRREAVQPAPRGAKATAEAPKDERLSMREARKAIFRDSRRIPIGQ